MRFIDKSFRGKGDISKLMAPGRERTQELRGFNDDYTDIVDYIVRCTHKIWEEGGMGLLYTHYQHNARMHTPYGTVYSREAWLTASINSLSAFPDRKIYADDVIWTGNDTDGFHTSHRILSVGRNLGYSQYGPPTGRKVMHQVVANCYVKENRVFEEWVVRDEMAVVRQLGLNPVDMVRKLIEQDERRGVLPSNVPLGEVKRTEGQGSPAVIPSPDSEGFDVDYFIRNALNEIWNWRFFNRIYEYFIETHECYTVGNRKIYGLGDYQAFIMAMIVMFPDAYLQIDHLYWLGNEEDGYRVAVRWSLLGTHEGPGVYGEPTGKRVNIMGISHFWVGNGRIYREWMIFDEIATLKQLLS